MCMGGAWIGLRTDAVGGNPKGESQPYCSSLHAGGPQRPKKRRRGYIPFGVTGRRHETQRCAWQHSPLNATNKPPWTPRTPTPSYTARPCHPQAATERPGLPAPSAQDHQAAPSHRTCGTPPQQPRTTGTHHSVGHGKPQCRSTLLPAPPHCAGPWRRERPAGPRPKRTMTPRAWAHTPPASCTPEDTGGGTPPEPRPMALAGALVMRGTGDGGS